MRALFSIILFKVMDAFAGSDMVIRFPTPAQAALGFLSSTYSFNLPVPKGNPHADNCTKTLTERGADILFVFVLSLFYFSLLCCICILLILILFKERETHKPIVSPR
jgi:hypothetical protein